MFQLKKIGFVLFLVASLCLATWAYLSIKKLKSPKVEALSILPDSCNIYFNTKDFNEMSNKINAQSLIIEKLKSFQQIQEACNLLKRFDSVFNNNEILKEELNNKTIHFALYNNCQNWLMAFNTKQTGTGQALLDQLNSVLRSTQKNNDVLEFKINKQQTVFGNIDNDIICFSNTKELIKKATNMASYKFVKSLQYQNFEATLNENNLCNIYINGKQSSSKLKSSTFLDQSELCGNLVLEPTEIKINGNLKVDSNNVLAALVNEETQTCESFINVLPNSLTHFEAYGFGTYTSLKKKLNKFYAQNMGDFWKEKGQTALYNIEKNFDENLSGQLIAFETNTIKDKFVAASVRDTNIALEHLNIIFDSVISEKGITVFKFKANESRQLFQPLFSTPIECATIKNNFIFFASSVGHLYHLMDEFNSNANIEANQNFMAYKNENFPSNFNYMVYYSPRMYEKALDQYFDFKNTGNHSPYQNLKHFSYTVVNSKKGFDFRLQLYNQAENNGNEHNTLWSLNLDTISKNTPYLFINHNTGENEIVIQDEKNNLNLVSARGSKLWTRNMQQQIISPVFMVDIFKNEKFQMLFNTEDYLYLIDRNGKDVKGFPVKLPSKATSPMSLLDYNEDRNYRIFIACKNNLIYNFNEQGKLQEGFAPVKTEKDIKLPVQYFKVGSNEYLVALDVEGKIYTFGRKGQGKIGLKNKAIQDCKAFNLNATNLLATSSLVYYDDKNSLINKVNFNDKKDVIKLDIESASANTTFNLIDANREADLVITQDKKLYAYNLNGEMLYEFNSALVIDKALYYSDETNTLYCMLNAANGEMEVNDTRNQKTKTLKAFNLPLVIDLFNDNKIYMILNYGNQLSCVAVD